MSKLVQVKRESGYETVFDAERLYQALIYAEKIKLNGRLLSIGEAFESFEWRFNDGVGSPEGWRLVKTPAQVKREENALAIAREFFYEQEN